ncbi:poly [ADP-ribose] polymerase 14, partial [Biomphalaria glabrata]
LKNIGVNKIQVMDTRHLFNINQGDFFEFLLNGTAHWGISIDNNICVYAGIDEVTDSDSFFRQFPSYTVKVTKIQQLVLTGNLQRNSELGLWSNGTAIAVKALKHIGSKNWRSSREFVDYCKGNIWLYVIVCLFLVMLSIFTPTENASPIFLNHPGFRCAFAICAIFVIYILVTNKRNEFLRVKENPFTGVKRDFMNKYLMEDLNRFNWLHKGVAEIKLTPEMLILTGKIQYFLVCDNFVQHLTTTINVHTMQIEMFGIQEYLQGDRGKDLVRKLEFENRCLVDILWDVKPETKNETRDFPDKSDIYCGWNFGNIYVRVIQGEIDKQKTDVIVSTVDKSLNLSLGTMASSVLRAAGDIIQIELRKRYKTGIAVGDYAQSSGGMLPCNYILHVCLPFYRPDNTRQIQNIISKLLDRAESLKAKSISFPALGTGILRYPPDISAEVIMEAIRQHAKMNTHSLQFVNIVVFPKDKKCFDAVFAKGGTLFSDNSGNLNDGISKVEGDVYQCGKVFLKIKQGDITKQNTDVIVNGLKDSVDLATSGQVGADLLEKSGQSLQRECNLKKNEMLLKGVMVTSAPKLFCKHIVHISLNKFDHSMDRGILMAFTEAEKLGAKSVSLPALQSVDKKTKAKTMKKWIFQSLKQFSKLDPQNVVNIKLVTNEPAILDEFFKDSHNLKNSTPARRISMNVKIQIYSADAHRNAEISRKLQEQCALAYNDIQKEESNLHQLTVKQIEKLKNLGIEHNIKVGISCQDGLVRMKGFDLERISQIYVKLKKMTKTAEETRELSNVFVKLKEMTGAEETSDISQVNCKLNEIAEVEDSSCNKHEMLDSFNIPLNETSGNDSAETSLPIPPSVQWVYGQGKNWNKYDTLLNSEIEKEYHNKASHFTRQDANGNKYFIDFTSMTEIHLDINDKKDSTLKIKRLSEAKDFTRTNSWPKYWDLMAHNKNLEVCDLNSKSLEYKEVKDHFKLSLNGRSVKIEKIQRIQNKSLFLQFCAKKDELELHNPENHPNERKLFHGTSASSINQINEIGFNRSFCGKNGTAYGKGVYFATESSYSTNYAEPDHRGKRYMYRARVLTGQFIATSPETKCPPKKPGTNRPYDSGGNKNQGIFVIFHDAQMYPEYLITYLL